MLIDEDMINQHSHCPTKSAVFLRFAAFLLPKSSLYDKKIDIGKCEYCGATIRVPNEYYGPVTTFLRILSGMVFSLIGFWLYLEERSANIDDPNIILEVFLLGIFPVLGWLVCSHFISAVALAIFPWQSFEADEKNFNNQQMMAKKNAVIRLMTSIMGLVLTISLSSSLKITYLQVIFPLSFLFEGIEKKR